jgi:hypothetical protein
MRDPELRKLVRDIVTEVIETKKEDEAASAAEQPVKRFGRLIPRRFTPTLGLSLVLLGMWLSLLIRNVLPEGGDVIPQEIVGTWTTTTPAYADRAFEITETSVTFYSSESTFTTHLISKVTSEPWGNAVLYTVEYMNLGEVYEFAFLYANPPQGNIRFKNQQDMEWEKQRSEESDE